MDKQKLKLRNTSYNSIKIYKYLCINLTKKCERLNHMEKYKMIMDWKTQNC